MAKPSEDPRFEFMPLQELLDRRHPDNAKDHDLGLIVESLKKHGLGRKPSVNEVDGKLFYGHGTTEALEILFNAGGNPPDQVVAKNGTWLIPVERGKRLTKKLASSYRLVDNKATEAGGWIEPKLLEVLTSLDDLTATGFDGDDVDQLFRLLNPTVEEVTVSDEAKKLQRKWKTKAGQLWKIGKHRLLCADSTKPANIKKLLPSKSLALLITSPPYLDVREYGGGNLSVETLAGFIKAWAPHCEMQVVNLGIIRRQNTVIRYWDIYIRAAEEAGLKLLSWNVWDRGRPWSLGQQTAMFPIEHEWILVFGRRRVQINRTIPNKLAGQPGSGTNRSPDGILEPKRRYRVHDRRRLGTIHRSATPFLGKDTGHPAVFPTDLPDVYIGACTKRGDLIADPFIGSGTTMVAAEQLSRTCYGMEIEPKYVAITLERMSQLGIDPMKA